MSMNSKNRESVSFITVPEIQIIVNFGMMISEICM